MCCAEPGEKNFLFVYGKLQIYFWQKTKARDELYQGVIEADVSFQTSANMVKLHNGDFGCGDGQDVFQT